MLSQGSITGFLECERAWVEIDQSALAHNVRQLRNLVSPTTEIMAVVKADAYGHGAVMVAQTALRHGVTWLGVATIPEGIELRKAGIEAPIVVLGAMHTPEQIQAIAHWRLQPTLCSPKQALIYSRTLEEPLPVHVLIDTGMSRLGPHWLQGAEFIRFVQGLPNLQLTSVYSHLATADSPNPTFMRRQQQRFEQVIRHVASEGMPLPMLHLANSAATLSGAAYHYDLVRVGLALYGLYPGPQFRDVVELKPVLQVKARVTLVKTLPPGTGVSYGHQFVAPHTLRLAVVGIGYADGVPRNLSNRMTVLLRGRRIQQIGAITMDQLMLDVTDLPDLQEGEVVTLLGRDGEARIGAEEWAEMLGTISWEILCGFKHRLPRIPTGRVG